MTAQNPLATVSLSLYTYTRAEREREAVNQGKKWQMCWAGKQRPCVEEDKLEMCVRGKYKYGTDVGHWVTRSLLGRR